MATNNKTQSTQSVTPLHPNRKNDGGAKTPIFVYTGRGAEATQQQQNNTAAPPPPTANHQQQYINRPIQQPKGGKAASKKSK